MEIGALNLRVSLDGESRHIFSDDGETKFETHNSQHSESKSIEDAESNVVSEPTKKTSSAKTTEFLLNLSRFEGAKSVLECQALQPQIW